VRWLHDQSLGAGDPFERWPTMSLISSQPKVAQSNEEEMDHKTMPITA
jgi:hypothetical protein